MQLVQRRHPILVVSVRSFAVDTSKEKRIAGNMEYLPPLRRTGRGTGVVTRIETEKETVTEIERMTEVCSSRNTMFFFNALCTMNLTIVTLK